HEPPTLEGALFHPPGGRRLLSLVPARVSALPAEVEAVLSILPDSALALGAVLERIGKVGLRGEAALRPLQGLGLGREVLGHGAAPGRRRRLGGARGGGADPLRLLLELLARVVEPP